jgi:peptidoglycan/LPS O-acetylase OafA/YrhL
VGRVRDESTPMAAAQTRKGFRLDIQGIRGFALVLVLACHAEVPGTAGGFVGLDIFYVLSGFLITGLIVTEIERTGTLSIRDFYARRARRLLPLAVTVLAVIAVLGLLTFPVARLHDVSGDIVSAALYFANWHFMAEFVDYFAFDDGQVSPVQHYWSLSVEEQFYLLWPLLLLAASAWVARAGWGRRGILLVLVAPIGAASLVYSVRYSVVDPQQAYFSTFTRAWELAAGAALFLLLPTGLRLHRAIGWTLAAGGLVVLVVTTVVYDARTPYPGWQALLPVGATAAVIIAGTATTMTAPIKVLTLAPMQFLGRISYAYYLWHWPALVFAAALWGQPTTRERVLITLAAAVPTIITHHLIEERFRRSRTLAMRPRRALAIGLSCTAAAVVAGLSLVVLRPGIPTAVESAVAGARVPVSEAIQSKATAVRPSPRDAKDDKGALFDDGCLAKGLRRESKACVYGDPKGRRTVVVFGDSHALQYFPAMRRIARRRGWRLVGLTRASCPIGAVDYQPTCNVWRENTLRRIEREEKPDLVVVSSSTDKRFRVKVGGKRLTRMQSQPLLEAGYARTFRRLARTGARIAVIRDQARAPFDVASCVSEHAGELRRCAFKPRRNPLFAFDARGARQARRNVKVIDPMTILCPRTPRGRRCPAVVGNALVYRDTYHLSATYARTLADWLERRLPRLR